MYDPTEPYRESRRAVEAQAIALCAEAEARAEMANSGDGVVTCAGCVADAIGHLATRLSHCEALRLAGLCQRQVYERLVMARLAVELIRVLAEAERRRINDSP
jgi:hypothetical protein